MAFFNLSTPVAKRIALLQEGQQLAAAIKSQVGSGLAAQASVKVTKVTLVSPTQAKVVCALYEGGKPRLANQTGVAVKQDGTWKVGVASFCDLLALENGGKTSALPQASKVARLPGVTASEGGQRVPADLSPRRPSMFRGRPDLPPGPFPGTSRASLLCVSAIVERLPR